MKKRATHHRQTTHIYTYNYGNQNDNMKMINFNEECDQWGCQPASRWCEQTDTWLLFTMTAHKAQLRHAISFISNRTPGGEIQKEEVGSWKTKPEMERSLRMKCPVLATDCDLRSKPLLDPMSGYLTRVWPVKTHNFVCFSVFAFTPHIRLVINSGSVPTSCFTDAELKS